MIRSGNFQPPPHLWPLGRLEYTEMEFIANGQCFTQPCLCHGTSIKTISDRDLRASGLVSTLRCWKADTSQLHWESNFLTLDPSRPCPVYLFIWLFICIFYKNILYNKLTNVSKVFSWALWTVIVNNLTWGGGHGNPWLETKLGRRESNQGTNTPLMTSVWSGGWSCGTQSLAWGLCTHPEEHQNWVVGQSWRSLCWCPQRIREVRSVRSAVSRESLFSPPVIPSQLRVQSSHCLLIREKIWEKEKLPYKRDSDRSQASSQVIDPKITIHSLP